MFELTRAVVDGIVAHAQAEYPKEACGMVAGAGARGTHVFRMRNVDASPISYTMDPAEQLRVMRRMRAECVEMLAIYHSHTATPAYPSPTDVRLAAYPDVVYMLVSLQDTTPDVQGYRIADGAITPEALRIIAAAETPHG